MAGLCAPLPTLRQYPRGHLRMTRGRCGLLLLHRDGLAPSTPCRSPGALCFAPVSGHSPLFNYFVGCGEQRLRNVEAERLGGLEIDNQIGLGRRLHRHITWFLALENAIDISRGTTDRLVP